MNTGADNSEVKLPDTLTRKLGEFEKRLCLTETVAAVSGGFCGILLTYALTFVSDRFWDTPGWLRVPLSLFGGAVFALFALRWMRHWMLRRRNARELAKLVQKQYRGMGDRLLGAVELADSSIASPNVSPALCRAAIRQVAEESAEYDFKAAVPVREPRMYAFSLLILLVVAVIPFAVFPRAGWNAFLRWAMPFASVQRYTFVSIEALPDEQVVPHGEEFEVCIELGEGTWRPSRASCRLENQPRIRTGLIDGRAVFRIPGQTSPGILTVRVGDVTREMKIMPVLRPELLSISAEIEPPVYLARTNETIAIEAARLQVLDSSHVSLVGAASRSLGSAGWLREEPDPARRTGPASLPDAASDLEPLEVEGRAFRSPAFSGSSPARCVFAWHDIFGLAGTKPYVLYIETKQDEAPYVECRGIARAVAMLEDEVLNIEVRAEDDYGIRELWVNWSSLGNRERGLPEVDGTSSIAAGGPDKRELTNTFSFSPIAFNIPEESMVTLAAYASDYMPGRKPAMSAVYRIYVLSRARHADLIKNRMEALQGLVEDLAREEEQLLQDNVELSEVPAEQLASEPSGTALKMSEKRERRNARQLDNISDRAEDLLREALRNTGIPNSTLGEWSEMINSMRELSENEMSQASALLKSAASDPTERAEQLDEAIELEKKILKSLRASEQGINKSIESMLARNFVNRLLLCASNEGKIGETLKDLLPEIIGMNVADMPDDMAKETLALGLAQETTGHEVQYIRDDLAGFYNRTRMAGYDEIRREMDDSRVVERMEDLADRIERNIVVESIAETVKLKEELTAWAERLGKEWEKNAASGGGGGEGAELDESDIEILIALIRARHREESLREQTRTIEGTRSGNRNYEEAARKLSGIQYELARDTRPLERRAKNADLRRLIEKVGGEMMNAGMYLRRPQTDGETIAIETEIIELLSNCIGMCSGQSSAAARMLQSMRMAGRRGGGSNAGGTTDSPSIGMDGSADGAMPDERDVEKAGRLDFSHLPEEFREELKAYFEAVEE